MENPWMILGYPFLNSETFGLWVRGVQALRVKPPAPRSAYQEAVKKRTAGRVAIVNPLDMSDSNNMPRKKPFSLILFDLSI